LRVFSLAGELFSLAGRVFSLTGKVLEKFLNLFNSQELLSALLSATCQQKDYPLWLWYCQTDLLTIRLVALVKQSSGLLTGQQWWFGSTTADATWHIMLDVESYPVFVKSLQEFWEYIIYLWKNLTEIYLQKILGWRLPLFQNFWNQKKTEMKWI
jgi:hypothetical protein